MSQNSEQIEAKLCAYLEGELDEQGRAEIEKHLQQNPSHRKLLAEVGRTRDLLRGLPREPAPPDICEAFQGQLERSVLLADLDDEASHSAMKINRWPQYFAVAAVVMLAAGLGLVVYFGLPPGGHERNYAVNGTAPTRALNEDGAATRPVDLPLMREGESEGVARGAAQPGEVPGGAVAMRGAGIAAPTSGPAAPPPEKRGMAEALSAPAVAAPATAPAQDLTVLAQRVQSSWETSERGRLFGNARARESEATRKAFDSVDPNAMCYLVTSAQPAATSERIGQELSKLQVAWSTVPPTDPAATQLNLYARQLQAQDQENAPAAAEAVTERPMQRGASQRLNAEAPVALRDGSAADKRAVAGRSTVESAAAATAPAPGAAGQSPQAAANPSYALAPAPQAAPSGDVVGRATAGTGASLIVARGLTREQAETLGTTLGARLVRQPVQVAAATQPTGEAGIPAPGDAAGGGFGGGGVGGARGEEPVLKQGDAIQLVTAGPGGQPAVTHLQVDPNGSVTVPGMGTFQCAGLTVTQLKSRLSETPQAGAATDAKLGALIEVKRLDDAAGQPARPADADAVAAVTEQDAGRRGARFRDEVLMRSRDVPAQQPVRAMRQADRSAPRPAAPQPSDSVSSAAPAPAPSGGAEAGGGAAGNAAVMRQKGEAPLAAGAAPAAKDFSELSADARPAPAPATQADRFDVVFLVQAEGAEAVAGGGATQPAEPTGPIEKFEILTVQLGDAEADAVNVRVGEDGTVELPKLGRVKAEGQTSEALREEIAAKLKSAANQSEPSKVTVKRLGTAEAGQEPQPEAGAPTPTDVAPPAPDKPQ